MAPNVRWADRHPVLASLRTAIITTVVLAVLAWLAKQLIPQPVQDAIWSWLTTKTEYPRGIWVLLVLALIAWALFAAWALARRYIHRTPSHVRYRTDEFFELRWRWQWFPLALLHSKCYRLGSLPHLKCYQRPELHHVAPSPAEVSMGMNVMHTARAEPAAFGGRLTFLFCRLQPGQERTGRCLR